MGTRSKQITTASGPLTRRGTISHDDLDFVHRVMKSPLSFNHAARRKAKALTRRYRLVKV